MKITKRELKSMIKGLVEEASMAQTEQNKMSPEMKKALKAFGIAAQNLVETWDNEEGQGPMNNYPFKRSFDEVAYDISTWVSSN